MKHERDLAESRSDLYGQLSSVYLHLPDDQLFSIDWKPAMKLLAHPLQGAEEPLRLIEDGLESTRNSVKSRGGDAGDRFLGLRRDWTRLFRGVDRDGPLPPYESLYRAGSLQEKPAQEVFRLFSEMGISIPHEWHQPPDYIGVELDFMRLLCEKEVSHSSVGDLKRVRETIEAEHSFIKDHLGLWVRGFCEEMLRQVQEGFFLGIARMTIGLIEYDRVYLDRAAGRLSHL